MSKTKLFSLRFWKRWLNTSVKNRAWPTSERPSKQEILDRIEQRERKEGEPK